jgi:hypothetical protein
MGGSASLKNLRNAFNVPEMRNNGIGDSIRTIVDNKAPSASNLQLSIIMCFSLISMNLKLAFSVAI